MKIGFDIGGVISKYPHEIWDLMNRFRFPMHRGCSGDWEDCIRDIYVISDMHPKQKIVETLRENGFCVEDWPNIDDNHVVLPSNIYSADYEKYGNMAKAILIRDLGLDIFVDDFDGYLQWDSSLGPQPILLKVVSDAFRPYWHDSWKCGEEEFGRRKALLSEIKNKNE